MTQNLTCTHATAANPFQVQFLGAQDIQPALELIQTIKNSGSLSKYYHLKDRNEAELMQLHADGYPLLGIKNQCGQLVAFATVSKTGDYDNSLIIRSLCTDPAYKGLGLGAQLVATATEWMMDKQGSQLKAKVAADNRASMMLFSKAGFSPLTLTWDQADGYWYYMMAKNGPSYIARPYQSPNQYQKACDFQ